MKWPQLLRVIRNIREMKKEREQPMGGKEKCRWVGPIGTTPIHVVEEKKEPNEPKQNKSNPSLTNYKKINGRIDSIPMGPTYDEHPTVDFKQ